MTEAVALRAAGSDDAAWIVARHGEIYAREFGFDSRFEDDIAEKMTAFQSGDDPLRFLWIAEADGARVGSIALSARSEAEAFLNFVLVVAAARGQGIAARLMEAALGRARAHGVRRVRLETYSCLVAARILYRRFGFAIEGTPVRVEKYGRMFDREFWALDLD